MKIRCTTIELRNRVITGRIEVCWTGDLEWMNLGVMYMPEHEWSLLVLMIALGTRRSGIGFQYADIGRRDNKCVESVSM